MNTNNPHLQEDEIDLVALLAKLYQKRKFIIKTIVIFALVGIFVALDSKEVFRAKGVFVVQNSEKQVSSSISGLAALAGVNLQSEAMGDIPPSLYPNIVGGITFKLALFSTVLDSSGLTYKDYLLSRASSPVSLLKKYTIGIPGLLAKNFRSTSQQNTQSSSGLRQLSEQDFELTELLEELIQVEVNEKEGFISLSAMDQNPKYAAVVAARALELLEDFITTYKTENAKKILSYVEKQYELKEQQYLEVQQELAEFKDQNKNISTAVFESNLQKIQTRYDLIYGVYLELSKQLEQAKLQVSKDIPNISMIESIYVPNKRESPKRTLIVVIYTFLGFILSCGWVLVNEPLKQISRQIRN